MNPKVCLGRQGGVQVLQLFSYHKARACGCMKADASPMKAKQREQEKLGIC
jgi:hypothetical protein